MRGGRYEIGIPWGCCESNFDNNYKLGMPRLKMLREVSTSKEPKIAEAYDPSLQRLRERGIRYKKENQWFLPYFTVVREDRTTTKVRIVFAAAARRHINNPSIRFDEGLYARNVSFVISLRWIFHPYQLV